MPPVAREPCGCGLEAGVEELGSGEVKGRMRFVPSSIGCREIFPLSSQCFPAATKVKNTNTVLFVRVVRGD